MENSFKFFENRECRYFPCHEGLTDFNCLFCYCPLNFVKHCPGNPEFMKTKDGKVIKNCMGCNFPHNPDNYEIIINFVKKNMVDFGEEALSWKKKKEKKED